VLSVPALTGAQGLEIERAAGAASAGDTDGRVVITAVRSTGRLVLDGRLRVLRHVLLGVGNY
jgi:hypothetical protein